MQQINPNQNNVHVQTVRYFMCCFAHFQFTNNTVVQRENVALFDESNTQNVTTVLPIQLTSVATYPVNDLDTSKLYYCLECPGVAFEQQWQLNRHTSAKHPQNKLELQCQYCHKQFSYIQNKKKHELKCVALKQQIWQPKPVVFQQNNHVSGIVLVFLN